MNSQALTMAVLTFVSVGGLAWVFAYPLLSNARQAQTRRENIARPEPVIRDKVQRSRREQVESSLKEVEARRQKEKNAPLSVRLSQAGLSITPQQFIIGSAGSGVVAALTVFLVSGSLIGAAGIGLSFGLGLPRWILNFLKKRRERNFLLALPDAVDVIVRGIKAGLPLHDSIKVVAADSAEPLKSEFNAIIETQTIGMPLGDACARLYERIPLPEANFFGIVISIQQKSGGNLSDALGNLSKVLRERRKMAEKIQAMSMEAKASAAIIGSLPPIVMLLVYLSTPDYISLLWTHPTGRLMLAGSVLWMSAGILVMRKMINFDF